MVSVSSPPPSLGHGPPCLPAADAAEVARRWTALVTDAAPELAPAAAALLARISPPHWALEWSLPYWLGRALGLEPADWLALALTNVLGLAYVRLQDDLTDGDLAAPESETAPVLATVLFDLWTRAYLQLFGGDARFWDARDQCMREWARATWRSLHPDATSFGEYGPADYLELAHLAAPLKICVTAACLLAQAAERRAPILASLELLLAGGVLLDHAYDWEEDLGRRRFNAFHAYAAGTGAPAGGANDMRMSVVRELTIGEAGRPYFRALSGLLQDAALAAQVAGVPELGEFARWLESTAVRYAYTLAGRGQANLHHAVAPILDAASARARAEKQRKEHSDG